MAGRAEFLYQQISDRVVIDALIGEPEDGHLDCKVWPANEKEGHVMLAKGICGLTNSDGGVLVIGMRAKQSKKDEPDVITEVAPVPDMSYVRSRILTLAGNLVEPPIVGIETREIAERTGSRSGFVIVFVPKSDGPPHRSRKDSRFYIRVGSVTLPMEYWQIEDRFGSRPRPKLEVHLDDVGTGLGTYTHARNPPRHLILGLRNSGAGIAKFPGVLFERSLGLSVDSFGIDGNGGFGIRLRPSEGQRILFSGGIDDVIYPGQTLMVAKLIQDGENKGIEGIPTTIMPIARNRIVKNRYLYKALTFRAEVFCEGCQPLMVEMNIAETACIVDVV